jgi:hypothetical protein
MTGIRCSCFSNASGPKGLHADNLREMSTFRPDRRDLQVGCIVRSHTPVVEVHPGSDAAVTMRNRRQPFVLRYRKDSGPARSSRPVYAHALFRAGRQAYSITSISSAEQRNWRMEE